MSGRLLQTAYRLVEWEVSSLFLPFDLSHLAHEIAYFVAVQFGDRRNTVNVAQQVSRGAKVRWTPTRPHTAPAHGRQA